MHVTHTKLDGVLLIKPTVYKDDRGFFLETFRDETYQRAGMQLRFVQENHSRSTAGVLRGLHYQLQHPQGKLVRVTSGAIYDVVVDVRKNSPTFGEWLGFELTEDNFEQLYVPPGYAHGFCVLSDSVDLLYKCTDYYHPEDEQGIIWNDSSLNIPWPVTDPIISAKDATYRSLAAMPDNCLPLYKSECVPA